MNNNIIGIIGGAGVAATNKLNELIEIEYTMNGAYRDCHHPEIITWQATNAPSRSMYLEGKGESFIDDYVNVAIKLKECGAKTLVMCCNTAHYAIEEIELRADIKMINLIQAVVKKVVNKNVHSVGLVASNGCLKGKVYEKYFSEFCPDIKIIYPSDNYQKLVTKGICNIKNKHRFDDINSTERPNYIFKNVRKHLIENGAEIVIMGCTDIRVDYYEKDNIDSLETLKNIIIAESRTIVERERVIPLFAKKIELVA